MYADPFFFGKDAGCPFVTTDCIENGVTNNEDFHCDGFDDDGCTADHSAVAFCLIYNFGNQIPDEFRYFTDTRYGGTQNSDFCSFRDPKTTNEDFNNICWETRGLSFANFPSVAPTLYPSTLYNINSRCIKTLNNAQTSSAYLILLNGKKKEKRVGDLVEGVGRGRSPYMHFD